jgi:tetratricopeptide (TPR) repeat protein
VRLLRCLLLGLLLACAAGAEPPRHLPEVDAALDRGAYDEAVTLAERAVEADPRCSGCWHWLGKAYGLKAKHAAILLQLPLARRCKAAFEKAVELDPGNTAARLDLLSYYVKAPGIAGGSAKRAAGQAEALARLSPARGHLAVALMRLEARELAAGETALKAAFEADPADWRVISAYVSFLEGQRRYQEALERLDGFLGRTPAEAEEPARSAAQARRAQLLARVGGRTSP